MRMKTKLSITRREFVMAASSMGPALAAGSLMFAEPGAAAPVKPSAAGLAQQSQGRAVQAKPRVLVFDVNQTMLDVGALRPHFARVFGDPRALEEWFTLLLQYSMVVTLADSYSDFGTVGRAALEMLAATRKVQIPAEEQTRIMQGVLTLPAHPDIAPNLTRLRAVGFRMVTLTNSSSSAVRSQLQNAGLTQFFDESISVEFARRFKPDLAVYRGAAAHLGVQPGELRLIAAHAWDVFGAMKAGWHAAFVARNGIPLFPLGPTPDIVGPDMTAVTDSILA